MDSDHRKPATAHPHYKWYVVAMLWWISCFNYADRQAIFSVLPLLETEMSLDSVQIGWLVSSFGLVYGVGAPFAGSIVDRIRRKTAILGGLQVWSVICMATAFSRNFLDLLFFRAAEGLGETFYYPASVSLISDYHGKRTRSRALGLHQSSVYFGTIAGGYFAGLVGMHYGWKSSFIVFGGCGMVLGIVLHKFLLEPERGAADLAEGIKPLGRASVAEILRLTATTPTVLFLMLGFMFANFGALVLLSWIPKYLHDRFDYDLAQAGLNATIYAGLASMAGAPVGGWLADAMRKRTIRGRVLVQAAGALAVAPFVLLCGRADSVEIVLMSLGFWGFFKGIYDANIFASVFDVVRPEVRGTLAGFMNMIGWLCGAGSSGVVVGYLTKWYGPAFAISSTSSVYVIAAGTLSIAGLIFMRRDAARVMGEVAVSHK
jgi:MFS family permease